MKFRKLLHWPLAALFDFSGNGAAGLLSWADSSAQNNKNFELLDNWRAKVFKKSEDFSEMSFIHEDSESFEDSLSEDELSETYVGLSHVRRLEQENEMSVANTSCSNRRELKLLGERLNWLIYSTINVIYLVYRIGWTIE